MRDKLIPVYGSSPGFLNEEDYFTMQWLDLNTDSFEKIKKPHRHDYFSMYFLVSGETVQFIDFHEYTVSANALIVMRPEQIHYHVSAKNANLLRIKFKEQFLLGLPHKISWQEIFNRDVVVLSHEAMKTFLDYLNLMIMEYDADLRNKEILSKLFSALLDKVSVYLNQNDSLENKRSNSIFKKFKELVAENALKEMKVNAYAKRLFISSGHLNDVVKEISGKNAKTIINEQRILEAKRLLYWTDIPVQEVAYKTGFEDPAYFTRFFKKHTGSLPSDFKNKDSNS